MKRIVIIALAVAALYSCKDRNDKSGKIDMGNYTGPKDEAKGPTDTTTVQVIDTAYNFGTIKEGEKVEYNFRFRNTGNKPLIIMNATATCGCTVPEKPEEPIKPGETGSIKVVFNSAGKEGVQEKSITVTSNAYSNFPPLILRGTVTKK